MKKMSVNKREASTTISGHFAFATAPDICIVPGSGPQPFDNFVPVAELRAGIPAKTTYAGAAILTAIGEVGPPSQRAHAGTGGGTVSGTYMGKAVPTTFSSNVIVEGHGVARLKDLTTQNDGNTVGIIDLGGLLFKYLKHSTKAAPPGGTKCVLPPPKTEVGPPPGETPPPGDTPPPEKEPPPDEEEKKDEELLCELKLAQVKCPHKRRSSDEGVLEVVPQLIGETISLLSSVVSPCGDKHPEWQVGGFWTTTLYGEKSSFEARKWTWPCLDPLAVFRIMTVQPHVYDISVEAHAGERRSFTVKAYPANELGGSADGEAGAGSGSSGGGSSPGSGGSSGGGSSPGKGGKGVDLSKKVKPSIDLFKDKVAKLCRVDPDRVKIFVLEGGASVSMGWEECDDDWQATCVGSFSVGYDPLLGIEITLPIPMGPLEVVRKSIELLGIGTIGLFARFSGKLSISGEVSYSLVNGWGGSVGGGGSIGVDIGFELKVTGGAVEAEAYIGGSIEGELGLEASGDGLTFHIGITLGVVKGVAKAKAKVGGWGFSWDLEFSEEVVIWEGYKLVDKDVPLL